MGTYIRVAGMPQDVKPAGQFWTLGELHGLVHGYIELVYSLRFTLGPAKVHPSDALVLVVNESGWAQDPQPFNAFASEIAGQPIAGDALLTTLWELGELAAQDAEARELAEWDQEREKGVDNDGH